jgi:hypothetical protein
MKFKLIGLQGEVMSNEVSVEKRQVLDTVLGGLMRRYEERVPDVKKVIDAMISKGIISKRSDIENDHIAFRTMGVPHLGIQSLEKVFLELGYTKKDAYNFEGKKLNAFWYSPPSPDLPRIFISELRVNELSPRAQEIIRKYTGDFHADPVDSLDLKNGEAIDAFLHTPMWEPPTYDEYLELQKESEYAAWVIFNRYFLNHFTISVHNLPESTPSIPDGANTIPKFNAFVEGIGVNLNSAGGVVKTSPDGLLVQSSTVAKTVEAEFQGGRKEEIPGSYVEFAWRGVLPQYQDLPKDQVRRDHRRDGFEAQNADGIFESTSSAQVQRVASDPGRAATKLDLDAQ